VSAKRSDEDVREVISQPSPTASIREPILEATAAIQSALKALYFSGDRQRRLPYLCSSVVDAVRYISYLYYELMYMHNEDHESEKMKNEQLLIKI
jgi:hypothetical protein